MTAMRPIVQPSILAASRLAVRGALGAALLIGTAQHAALAHETGAHSRIQDELRKGDTAKAVELGEAAVAQAPQEASLRAELGHAYLRAGRFESAARALNDALALGDAADRIMLSLALAQIACGDNRAALATLDHGANIGPADLGLALALAGDTVRGIAVLTDAVRDGSGSKNLRQNLAYAYALDGRWADATLTAGFDLPPDQVNARLQKWAQSMQAGGERIRIARLLNVPLIADAGMPAALALNQPQIEPALAAAPLAVAQTAAAPDLPPTPAVAAAPLRIAPPAVVSIAPALAPIAPAAADRMTAPPALTFVSMPIVEAIPAPTTQALFHQLAVRPHGVSPASDHFVQLAAYHSRRSAELGKAILAKRYPPLRGHGLLIAETKARGRSYWRVVMAGFDGASASNMCASLKRHGAACFAYAARPGQQDQSLALANDPR